jgi:MFS family permease
VFTGLWMLFFLLGMSLGLYLPAMTNILAAQGLDSGLIQWAWLAGPVASLISPVAVGALADNRFAAQKVLGWAGLLSAVLLAVAFKCLESGLSPWWFIGVLFCSSIVAAPLWSTLASVSMTHLVAGEREFPMVRLGATIGWMLAGFMTSWLLKADTSPVAGYAGAVVRACGGLLAFTLPNTPPPGRSRSWRTLMGFSAFSLLKERDHLVFFVVTALLSMPLAAFYMWTPRHLVDLGDLRPTWTMALGQVSEIFAMFLMVSLMTRFRVKSLLTLALALSAVRYALFAWSGLTGGMVGMWIGIALHGLCYTFYFITAQMFLDRRVPTHMRSQAQGLLSLVSGGIGTLFGTIFVRWLYDAVVVADRGGWAIYWTVLGLMISGITVTFVLSYRGKVPSDPSGEVP